MTTPAPGVTLVSLTPPPAVAVHLFSASPAGWMVSTACILWAVTSTNTGSALVVSELYGGSAADAPRIWLAAVPVDGTTSFDFGPSGTYCPSGIYTQGTGVGQTVTVYTTPVLPGQ